MGFNLKMFFEGLQELLGKTYPSDAEKLESIKNYVEGEHRYAKDCGQIY